MRMPVRRSAMLGMPLHLTARGSLRVNITE